MKRCPHLNQLQQFVEGALNPSDFEHVDEHVESCEGCQQRLSELVEDESRSNGQPSNRNMTAAGLDVPTGLIARLADRLVKQSGISQPYTPTNQTCGDAETDASELPNRLGDYRVIRRIGRGGMGVVYEAEQLTLGRQVALKVLPQSMFQNPASSQRFQREAASAAGLHHTNIVPVYEAGQDNGTFYYAMQLIDGVGLDVVRKSIQQSRSGVARSTAPIAKKETQVSHSNKSNGGAIDTPATQLNNGAGHFGTDDRMPADGFAIEANTASQQREFAQNLQSVDSPTQHYHFVAEIGRQIAGALDYAHDRGIIHRDVKPSNLILDGNGIVWLADFGLAKRLDDDLSGSAVVPGTLRYMSPERFQGVVDRQCDVYSLGASLYELLTLQPAFSATGYLPLIEKIASVEPKRPQLIDPAIPLDLQTIILKAMSKEPAHRYETAAAMGKDLTRFLDGQPILGRRAGLLERFKRWSAKNAGLAASLVVITLLLLTGAIGGTLAAMTQSKLAAEKAAETKEAKTQSAIAYQNAYFADMRQAHQDLKNGQMRRMLTTLRSYVPTEAESDIRGWEWHYLLSQAHQDNVTVSDFTGIVRQLHWLPDGDKVVSCGSDSTLRIWTKDGRLIRKIPVEGIRRFAVIGKQAPLIATACGDAALRIFDPESGKLVRVMNPTQLKLTSIDSNAATGKLAIVAQSSSGKSTVLVMDPGNEQVEWELNNAGDGDAKIVRFSPDGKFLALGFARSFGIYEIGKPTAIQFFQHPAVNGFQCLTAAWHPDSRHYALGANQSGVQVFDRTIKSNHSPVAAFLDNSSVDAISFSSDGRQICAGSRAQRVDLIDWSAGTITGSLRGHLSSITSIAPHPDGQLLVSSAKDGSLKWWTDLVGRHSVADRIANLDTRADTDIRFTANGKYKWQNIRNNYQRISNAKSGDQILRLPGYNSDVKQDLAVAGSCDGMITWGNLKTGEVFSIKAHDSSVQVALSPDAAFLASCSNGEVKLWDTATRAEVACLYGHQPQTFQPKVVWSNDGKFFATSDSAHRILIWDAEKREQLRSLHGLQGAPSRLRFSFSADSSRFMACDPENLKVWDVVTGRELLAFDKDKDWDAIHQSMKQSPHTIVASQSRMAFSGLDKAAELESIAASVDEFQKRSLHSIARQLATNPDDQTYSPARALKLSAKALNLNPADKNYLFTHGLAQYRNERHQESAKQLTLAADSGLEADYKTHYLLALCYSKLNISEKCDKHIKRAEELMAGIKKLDAIGLSISKDASTLLPKAASIATLKLREYEVPELFKRYKTLLANPQISKDELKRAKKIAQKCVAFKRQAKYSIAVARVQFLLAEYDDALKTLEGVGDLSSNRIGMYLMAACLKCLDRPDEAEQRFSAAEKLKDKPSESEKRLMALLRGMLLIPERNQLGTIKCTTLEDEFNGIGDGVISLREAIVAVADGGTIEFDQAGTINLKLGEIFIDKSVSVIGPGADKLTIDGGKRSRLFFICDRRPGHQSKVSLVGLHLTNGKIASRATSNMILCGGAMTSCEALSVTECTLDHNESDYDGGAVFVAQDSQARFFKCNFRSNASKWNGGGIQAGGAKPLVIDSCLFESNKTRYEGSAIRTGDTDGSMILVNSTFANNLGTPCISCYSDTDINHCTFTKHTGSYGAIACKWLSSLKGPVRKPRIRIRNSILHGNLTKDGEPRDITVQYDLPPIISNSIVGNVTITENGSISQLFVDDGANLLNVDPKLGPLADNGGDTRTFALQEDSPAIDAGTATTLEFDQRGRPFTRQINNRPDIGAFEFGRVAEDKQKSERE